MLGEKASDHGPWYGRLALRTGGSFVLLLACFLWWRPAIMPMLQEYVAKAGIWGPVVYVLFYTVRPLAALPALPFNLSAPLFFGPVLGASCIMVGGLGGAMVCFWGARLLGTKVAAKAAAVPLMERWQRQLAQNGFGTVLFLRLTPIFPYDPVSLALGLSPVSARTYAAGTLLGMAPGAVAYGFSGSLLRGALGAGDYVLIALCFVLAFGAPLWIYRRQLQSAGLAGWLERWRHSK